MDKTMTKIKFLPIYLFSLIPFKALYLLSDFYYLIVYYLIRYRRKVVSANLRNSFPDKTEKEIRNIEKAFYRHFCDFMLETVKVFSVRKKEIKKRFQIKNLELIENYFKQKKSIILYMGHFGNWEWLTFLSSYAPHQSIAFYKKLSNEYFNQLVKTSREQYGAKIIETKNGYKSLLEYAKKNILTFTLMLGDQSPRKSDKKHWLRFLNQDTAFLVGTERIAKRINQVVVYSEMIKKSRGIYEIEFFTLTENMKKLNDCELIDMYAKRLESSIIKQPHLWLWSHKRWKLCKKNTTQAL